MVYIKFISQYIFKISSVRLQNFRDNLNDYFKCMGDLNFRINTNEQIYGFLKPRKVKPCAANLNF